MSDGRCIYCGEQIDVSRDYRRVVGWERAHRSAGGTNAIRAPERGHEFACWWCVDKLVRGIASEQESLL